MIDSTDRRVLVVRNLTTGNFFAQELPESPRDVKFVERIVSAMVPRPDREWIVIVVPSTISSRDVTRYAEEKARNS
jgi:hypothetical protein